MSQNKIIHDALPNFVENRKSAAEELKIAKYEYGDHTHRFPNCFPWSRCHEMGRKLVELTQRKEMYDAAIRGLRGGITTQAVELLDTVIIPAIEASIPEDPSNPLNYSLFGNPHTVYSETVGMRQDLASVKPTGLRPRK